ncbi:hypothetical protein FRC06_005951 [Ceratobasidium sp. 370]|nr:hypothetical protein FRC06_005951 [Ceratobasidium sp. 370]
MKLQATGAGLPGAAHEQGWKVLPFSSIRAVVVLGLAAIVLLSGHASFFQWLSLPTSHSDNPFEHLRAHCANATPISSHTFLARQRALAQVLHRERIGAYIVEPGASSTYFASVSARQWHTSERVFLVVVTPAVDHTSGDIEARVSVLAPEFERDRARLLGIPSKYPIRYITWAEEQSPYETLVDTLGKDVGVIAADEAIRLFVSEGLKGAGKGRLDVKMAPRSIRALRERKGEEELALMRCANEVTLLAIRAVRERMYIGIRESEVGRMMSLALGTAGLQNTFALVQFGENAALPHGSGSDRVLRADDMVLIDTGGSLYNYESDVTRTFALPGSVVPAEHVRLWETVAKVQAHAFSVARRGVEARAVDQAARSYMDDQQAGMSRYFSHRLGHGIGLEGHEAPYLRRGADNTHSLEAGNTMSDEPGIYILGKVGVRLEDCFYISENGDSVLLTSGVGGFARDLLHPRVPAPSTLIALSTSAHMFQPIAAHAGSAQWTVTYPALVAPRPLRPSAHAHYHPYHPGPTGRGSAARHTRPPRLRVVPSPAEALARISLVDQPTPPPDIPDDAAASREFGTVSTLSSETLEEFLRILRNGGGGASPVQTPETDARPVILSCAVKLTSPTDFQGKRDPLASAPAAWDSQASNAPNDAATPEPALPMTAPAASVPEWCARPGPSAVRRRTRTQSQSPPRDHGRWSHPYRRDTAPHSRNGSEKSSRHSRGSSFCEPTRPCARSASKRASATSWASSETDVSEPADLGSSQHEEADVELASNCGDVDDEEFQARSADTEFDSSTCEDGPKTHSARGRMLCTPASPISRRHTSNPLSHYSPVLFETLAARARANAFSPSHSRSPSPSPAPAADPLDDDVDDADEYQPPLVVRMEMPQPSRSSP